MLAGCDTTAPPHAAAPEASSEPSPAATPIPFDVGPIKSAAEYLADARFAAADSQRGELLSLACAACHTFRAGERHNIGPNLHGVFGRPAAAALGFAYSDALQRSGLVWTPLALEAWLAEPAEFVPGTTMAFTGYKSADDRRDLLAYLLQATQ
jgi:cytochrome c